MVTSIKRWWWNWLERRRGYKTVSEKIRGEVDPTNIRSTMVDGSVLTIWCQRKEYVRHYNNHSYKPTSHTVYHVYSTCSDDSPEILKKAVMLELTFPPFFPDFIDDLTQKNAAIDAYLDLILEYILQLQKRKITS